MCVHVCVSIRITLSAWGHAFSKGECVTHMKIHEIQKKMHVFGDFRKLGQYDLLYTYWAIARAWYILWG